MQGFEFVGATHIPDANGDYSAAPIPSPPLAWDGFLKSTPDFLEVLGLRARMLGLGARYGLGWQAAIPWPGCAKWSCTPNTLAAALNRCH